jgi:hypothetical protein
MGDRKIACGHLRNRHEVIQLLQNLSAGHQLMGRGIGWVDVHLLGPSAGVSETERLRPVDAGPPAGRDRPGSRG